MRVRRTTAGTTAAAMILGVVALAVAPAASATDPGSATVACDFSDSTVDVFGAVGDTFTLTSVDPHNCAVTTSDPGVVSWVTTDAANPGQDPAYFFGWSDYSNFPTSGPGTVVTFTLTRAGSTTWRAEQGALGITVNFTVTDAPSTIPMWVQAYARADKDAPCPDGWNPSWDQWPNGGTGGFVCQRSLRAFGN